MVAETVWSELRTQQDRPIFRRVSEDHPFDVYLGLETQDNPVLMLISALPVDRVPRLKALDISQNRRQDGRFAVLIKLATLDLFHPFCQVCDDLIESLRRFHEPGREAAFLLSRVEKWRRLLEATRGLSHEQLLGLLGELLFLETLIGKMGPVAVEGWLGPDGAPQDFQVSERVFEIKVCPIGRHSVVISSLEQLYTAGTPATLIVYAIGGSTSRDENAFSPNGLIQRIRDTLRDTNSLSAFELKLTETGFASDQPESDSLFVSGRIRSFNVTEEFPRLTPAIVPPAITEASYSLDLDHCTQFEMPFAEVLNQ